MLKRIKRDKNNRLQFLCQNLIMAFVSVLVLATIGCSKRYSDLPAFWPVDIHEGHNYSVGRFKTSYLADQIEAYYRGSNPGPIGVTTFVNLDDLYTTSTFGRIYGEQLMSELAMKGFDVIELRHADALQFLSNEGEFALSRQAGQIRRERQLGGVVVGTYVASPDRVYVNARLLDPSTSLVLSAGSVEFEKTNELTRLLRGGSFPTTLERIPVKHIGLQTYPLQQAPSYVVHNEESDVLQVPTSLPPSAAAGVEPRLLPESGKSFGGFRIDRGRPENPVDSKQPAE